MRGKLENITIVSAEINSFDSLELQDHITY